MSKVMVRGVLGSWQGRVFAAAMMVLASVVLGTSQAAASPRGHVTEASGKVEIGRGQPPVFAPASKGASVSGGDVIRTGGGGRVELELGAGTVRVYENSLLRIPQSAKTGHQVELSKGRSIFDVIKESVKDRFEIKTPEVVVSVKGTRFEVDLRGELTQVAVFRGTVGVRTPEASLELETLVRQGFAASGAANVPFELDLTSRSDPWDAWAKLSDMQDTAMNKGRDDRKLEMHKAALSAARASSAKELVEIASKRNPEVARKVAALRKERAQAKPGGAPTEQKSMPAAPAQDQLSDMTMQRRKAVATRMKFDNEDLEMKVDPAEIAKRLDADREKLSGTNFMVDDGEIASGVETPDDPVGSVTNGGWDPTPELSMMEVASIATGLSYQELIQLWYSSVQDMMETNPEIFSGTDPSQYQTALEQKFVELGLGANAAGHLAEYITSQINN